MHYRALFLVTVLFISGCGPPRYTIKGIVVDSTYKKPVYMAIVTISNDETKTGYTDKDGTFFFVEKKKGMYSLSAYAQGFKRVVKNIEVRNKEEHVTIELPREFSILTGVVVDAETGEPLSAVVDFVSMDEGVEPPSRVYTDPVTGLYKVELLPAHYRVRAKAYGYRMKEKGIIIKEGERRLLDFELVKEKE